LDLGTRRVPLRSVPALSLPRVFTARQKKSPAVHTGAGFIRGLHTNHVSSYVGEGREIPSSVPIKKKKALLLRVAWMTGPQTTGVRGDMMMRRIHRVVLLELVLK